MKYHDLDNLDFDWAAPHVLRLTFADPATRNAVTTPMHTELARLWHLVDSDPDVRAVIVTGADGAFSSGGDLKSVEGLVNDLEFRMRAMREVRDIVYGVINCSKPIVSAMTGPAVGAGLAVGLLADISIATPRARFIDGHTRLGVAAGDHAVLLWPLLCGLAKSRYYLLTCERLTGEEAERIGLVSLCVPEETLQEKALEIATGLARGSQSAIRWTKLALNGWLRDAGAHFETSLAYELCGFGTPDAREGVAAIREQRSPRFAGAAAE